MPSQDSETMAGWETANSMLLHNTSHMSNHEEFVSKYMTPSFMSNRDASTTTTANRLSAPFVTHQKRMSASFPSFCIKDNVDQCISYLDQELTTLGFPTLYMPDSPSNSVPSSGDVFNLIQMINSMYELIQRHQQSLQKQEDLENKQMRADSDFANLQTSHTRLKEQIEQVQRDNVALEEKERQHLVQHKAQSAKFKNAREEIKKLEGILKSRDVQFKHDLKKKEREINRMKEKVHQLLTDKNQERRIGMDILNSLQRTDGKRGTWKTGKTGSKHEEEMYRLIITNYEERQKELMLENQVLRESLSNMQKELVDLLNRQGDKSPISMNNVESDTDDATSVSSSVTEELSTGHFQMPFEMVREGIETNMKQKWRKLKEHIERMEKENKENTRMSSPEDEVIPRGMEEEVESMRKEISRLKSKVATYKELAEQQEQVLQSVQDNHVDDTLVSFIRDSHLLDEKENLADEKKMFYQQKATFEKERRSFTEAAIRLGHERRRFDEERSSFLQQQLMLEPSSSNSNSFTSPPLRPPRSISKANSPNLSSLTPDVSPPSGLQMTPKSSAQMHRIATPTTVELYRALKLLPDNGECLNSSRESLHAPSFHSDTDHSGMDSPTPSGTTTPRSTSSRSCASQSSYRSIGQGSNRSRGSGQSSRSGRSEGKAARRNEEHKLNLRIAVAQKNRKTDLGLSKRTGTT